MKLAQRLSRVAPSPTLAITAKANALKKEGRDIVGFGAGEPDFDTPEPIKEACRKAIAEGKTKYTPEAGEVELRQALARDYQRRYGLEYGVEQVVVSNGGKQSLYNLFMSLLDPGDEVIVIAPYWVSYPAQVLLADGQPVIIDTTAESNFCPSTEQLDAAYTARTRAIVLNSPSNPTGALWTKAEMERIVAWLLAHPDVVAIYDGIYHELIYDGGTYYELAALHPDLVGRAVCVNGVAKTFSMTGWRIGWALGPLDLMRGSAKLQSQATSAPNTMAQWATIAALSLDRQIIDGMRQSFDTRRVLTCELLEAIPRVKLVRPKGAFYAFPDLSAYLGGRTDKGVIEDDVALSAYLLDSVGVAVVPGSAFGAPGFVRISYATGEAAIRKGIQRIGEALERVAV